MRRRRDNWWWNNEATALAVAAVGCLPTAATAVELLGRRNVSLRGADGGLVVQVARTRGVPWLAELAYRLADRLRRDDSMGGWGFVAELLVAEKAAPPTGDQFVEGWLALMAWPPQWQRPVPLVDRLRADVFLDALVPRLFEVDGAGTRMSFDEFMTDEKLALPRALARLAREGRLDRTMLLDGCVSRLLRGDRPAALRAFVALHALLEPTASEVDQHRGDYLRLLADAPGPWRQWRRRRFGLSTAWKSRDCSTHHGPSSSGPTRRWSAPSSAGWTSSPAGTPTGRRRSPKSSQQRSTTRRQTSATGPARWPPGTGTWSPCRWWSVRWAMTCRHRPARCPRPRPSPTRTSWRRRSPPCSAAPRRRPVWNGSSTQWSGSPVATGPG
ncbi:hypothetical protein [Micromonospora sp. NBC_00617]|uniref:hypothetical protein n=1 Tax=Micromonospora sp. NBC_00617 TaxID=2903587 RepID=UPI0030E158DD